MSVCGSCEDSDPRVLRVCLRSRTNVHAHTHTHTHTQSYMAVTESGELFAWVVGNTGPQTLPEYPMAFPSLAVRRGLCVCVCL